MMRTGILYEPVSVDLRVDKTLHFSWSKESNLLLLIHCVKYTRIRVFSDSYIPV